MTLEKSKVLYLQYSPHVETAFWHQLANKKMNEFKLDQPLVKIRTDFRTNAYSKLSTLTIDHDSFEIDEKDYYGYLKNVNTIEEFKAKSKQQLINEFGQKMFDSAPENDIKVLKTTFLYSFVNLKSWKFHFWFAFPSISPNFFKHSLTRLTNPFSPEDMNKFKKCLLENENNCFFKNGDLVSLVDYDDSEENPVFCINDKSIHDSAVTLYVKNFVLFASMKTGLKNFSILIIRPNDELFVSVEVTLPLKSEISSVNFTGWAKNSKNELKSNQLDLSALMNPEKLAENATQLNLKLMKWRLSPNLDLEKIASQRCLLLGAGTLGSNVARCLLGWGITNITLVDCGKVSYSNPVRQSLFTFDHCKSSTFKADAAVESLKAIYPLVNAKSFKYLIPMPDHPSSISDSDAEDQFLKFQELFKTHDIIFLLTDTRESRWLPTVMGKAHDCTVVNAAVGFDSFVVMRHGSRDYKEQACYFCQDVVAPADSTTNRSLDQQCTVSRPGLSFITSGLVTELAVNSITDTLGEEKPPQQIRQFLRNYQQITIQDMQKFDIG